MRAFVSGPCQSFRDLLWTVPPGCSCVVLGSLPSGATAPRRRMEGLESSLTRWLLVSCSQLLSFLFFRFFIGTWWGERGPDDSVESLVPEHGAVYCAWYMFHRQRKRISPSPAMFHARECDCPVSRGMIWVFQLVDHSFIHRPTWLTLHQLGRIIKDKLCCQHFGLCSNRVHFEGIHALGFDVNAMHSHHPFDGWARFQTCIVAILVFNIVSLDHVGNFRTFHPE
mmetsp:Transcript_17891/g.38349  ORF Transcript_17891/g.38349 Transcript_17891/m.38349 type:complete len:225 (-) Transcript_17891:1741-2415(-)